MTRRRTSVRRTDLPAPGQSRSLWRAAGAGAGFIGTEGIAGYLHPALGAVLAAADVIAPVTIALILLAAILSGSKETVERVFRLLRWLANRPEPPAPAPPRTRSRRGTASTKQQSAGS
jgi:hypothetical protein